MLADRFSQITSLISVIIWPVVVVVALIFYRRELSGFLRGLSGRISRVSFAGASVEFVPASEAPSSVVSAVTEFIDATSTTAGIASDAQASLQLAIHTSGADFVKIDLRGGKAWLTSRLYIFSIILSETANVKKLIFVQRSDRSVETFIGMADPLVVADRLGNRFRWLSYALAGAETQANPSQLSDLPGLARPFTDLQWASLVAEQYLIHPLIRDVPYNVAVPSASEYLYLEDPTAQPIRTMLVAPAATLPTPQLPIVGGVSPQSGPSSGGTPVSIAGSGFSGVKDVRFGNSPAPISGVTDIQISVFSPPGEGKVQVKVLTEAGSSDTTDDWVTIRSSDGSLHAEHAAWIQDEQHLISLLGDTIDTSCIVETTQTKRADLSEQVLREHGDFVVIVDRDRKFRRLINRRITVERLARKASEASLWISGT